MKPAISLALALALAPALAAAQNTTSEVWPELDVYWRPAAHQRTMLELSSETEREGEKKERSVGLYQDYLKLPWGYWRAGYRYTFGAPGNPYREERGVIETELTAGTFGVLRLLSRTRAELRRVKDDDSYRGRERLTVAHLPFSALGMRWTPYVGAEAYFDSRYRTIERLLGRAGTDLRIRRHVSAETYYARQASSRGKPKSINAVGLKIKLDF